MFNTSTITQSLAVLLIASAGIANAAPEKRSTSDNDLLRGPKVTRTQNKPARDDSMQDNDQRQMDQERKREQKKGRPDQASPYQEYQGALRRLMNPNSESGLDLTDEQRSEIKAILVEQRNAMKAYREAHKEEFEAVMKEIKAEREAMREERKASDEKPAGKREHKPTPAQEKMRALMEGSPADGQALEQIKAILTTDQQATIKAHMEVVRAKRANGKDRKARNNDADSEQPKGPKARRKKMNADDAENSGQRTNRQNKKPRKGKDG